LISHPYQDASSTLNLRNILLIIHFFGIVILFYPKKWSVPLTASSKAD
jgi:hypothetical protein